MGGAEMEGKRLIERVVQVNRKKRIPHGRHFALSDLSLYRSPSLSLSFSSSLSGSVAFCSAGVVHRLKWMEMYRLYLDCIWCRIVCTHIDRERKRGGREGKRQRAGERERLLEKNKLLSEGKY